MFPLRTPRPSNRRVSPRALVRGTAAYLSAHRIVIARAADVSLTGAFVQTQNPDPIETLAQLRLVHQGIARTFNTKVVRISFASDAEGAGAGMGLEFVSLSKEEKKFVARYVASSN